MRTWVFTVTGALAGALFALSLAAAPAAAQTTIRVSVGPGGVQQNHSSGFYPTVSADGRYVAFWSDADNLVPGDTNSNSDAFVRDTLAGTTVMVSVATNGAQGDGQSSYPSISADGRYVTFDSGASNLVSGDSNGLRDVFARDTVAGTTKRVSVATDGTQANKSSTFGSISADGQYVTFYSEATNLVPGDTNGKGDNFVRDTKAGGATRRISIGTSGIQGNDISGLGKSAISADGRYVAFWSRATTLVPGDTNGKDDIFVRDTVANTTTRVSLASDGAQGNGFAGSPSLSADGRYVAFGSEASNLVPDDTNEQGDIFVRDTLAGSISRVSLATSGEQANGPNSLPSISADGRYVAFTSYGSNSVSGDTNDVADVFVRDTVGNTTTRVSVATDGTQGNGFSDLGLAISADGRYVVFGSEASTLVPNDTNGQDIFMHGPLFALPAEFTFLDAATALRIAGGFSQPSPDEAARLNVEPASSGVTLFDALGIARKVAGLDANA
jgi:Tol biopolymer transport system component